MAPAWADFIWHWHGCFFFFYTRLEQVLFHVGPAQVLLMWYEHKGKIHNIHNYQSVLSFPWSNGERIGEVVMRLLCSFFSWFLHVGEREREGGRETKGRIGIQYMTSSFSTVKKWKTKLVVVEFEFSVQRTGTNTRWHSIWCSNSVNLPLLSSKKK